MLRVFAERFHPEIDESETIAQLRAGKPVSDLDFDRVFPEWARRLSSLHWTPVNVALRAAALLTRQRPNARILDVGSGVGKFCLIGGLAQPASFTGLEQRPHFVELSRELASRFGVDRASFRNGDAFQYDWSEFDGVYLFNPFQENLPQSPVIDRTVEVGPLLYDSSVSKVEKKLAGMRPGTRVVTYWGFGGLFPPSYRRMLSEYRVRGVLEYWVKTR